MPGEGLGLGLGVGVFAGVVLGVFLSADMANSLYLIFFIMKIPRKINAIMKVILTTESITVNHVV